MRQTFLTDAQAKHLREEKETLANIQQTLASLDTPKESLERLQKAILQLDELFLVVVTGEFNAGKSALLNALLGASILREGATPTTSRVTLVKWGAESSEEIVDEGYAVLSHPLPILKELNIVDTPGTNAVIREHERLTDEFVPRSDLVLFATSADRPLTESERQFLQRILTWGKKVVFVLNKVDIFDDDASLDEVRNFIVEHATKLLGYAPDLFPVSAKLAQRALQEEDPAKAHTLWQNSRLGDLEQYINTILDDNTRLTLKFNNPIGIAETILATLAEATRAQAELLGEDMDTANALKTAIRAYENELAAELSPRLSEVENILHRLENRGMDFFERKLRLPNIGELIRGDKIRDEFEREVLTELPQQIEGQVRRIIDWFVQKDLHEWQQVMSYLQRRQNENLEHIVGESQGARQANRRDLIDTVGRAVENIVQTYDREEEARDLAAGVENAVAQMALLEAGAVGLGAVVSFAVLSSALDITGTLAAGTMAVVGFFIIPFKRKRAKENFQKKITKLRTTLHEALVYQFNNESEKSLERMREGIAPYTRYVDAEHQRISQAEVSVNEMRQTLSTLRARGEIALEK